MNSLWINNLLLWKIGSASLNRNVLIFEHRSAENQVGPAKIVDILTAPSAILINLAFIRAEYLKVIARVAKSGILLAGSNDLALR